ncbi:MAG: 7-carboxy-7-deazaguanine synthase QueE [bacterium]
MIINISEIFYSIQGEGTSIGTPALFVRLQGCNLTCTWCDTPYTWKPGQNKEFIKYDVPDLANEIEYDLNSASDHCIIVFSGGEPLLQQEQLQAIISSLHKSRVHHKYEIETNGTLFPGALEQFAERIQLNVSPKLENSEVPKEKRYCRDILSRLAANDSEFTTFFKFVVTGPADIDEILSNFDFVPREKIIIMPEGVTRESQVEGLSNLVEICKREGFRLIPRMHTLIWENQRGV